MTFPFWDPRKTRKWFPFLGPVPLEVMADYKLTYVDVQQGEIFKWIPGPGREEIPDRWVHGW